MPVNMDAHDPSRRAFTRDMLQSLAIVSLLEVCFRNRLFAGAVRPVTDRWLKEVNGLCADLRVRALGQADWQRKVEELFARVDLPDLLRSIDFDRLVQAVAYPDDRAAVIEVDLPGLSFGRMDFVDPDRAEVLRDDTVRARRLEFAEAVRLYGRA